MQYIIYYNITVSTTCNVMLNMVINGNVVNCNMRVVIWLLQYVNFKWIAIVKNSTSVVAVTGSGVFSRVWPRWMILGVCMHCSPFPLDCLCGIMFVGYCLFFFLTSLQHCLIPFTMDTYFSSAKGIQSFVPLFSILLSLFFFFCTILFYLYVSLNVCMPLQVSLI